MRRVVVIDSAETKAIYNSLEALAKRSRALDSSDLHAVDAFHGGAIEALAEAVLSLSRRLDEIDQVLYSLK